ncbi:MAG: hypothetical protein J0L66_17330 [Cytophagales bacterium]|nr:hypothetical protein [Cytophagales bacterium]
MSMDLNEAWKKLAEEKLQQPFGETVAVNKKSKHPVQKLINNLLFTLGFVVFFETAFIALAVVMPQPIVKIGMVFMMAVYVFYFLINFRILKHIRATFRLDENVVHTLRAIYNNTLQSLKMQRRASLFIYPLAGTSGFFLGLSIESNVLEMLQNKFTWLALVVTVAILTPISYYLAVWLEKISYGKYLHQLHTMINELSQE